MNATIDHWEDLGDGTVRVFARTPLGEWASVVVGRNLLGSATMYKVLDKACFSVDRIAWASHARAGKSEEMD